MSTTDREMLLDAIRANPDEDTPRLMYADEIEADDPERAEFIRVQCELAKLPREAIAKLAAVVAGRVAPGFVEAADPERNRLIERQGRLWLAHRDEWFGNALPAAPFVFSLYPDDNVAVPQLIVRRGFIDEVRLTAAAFCGGVCERCGGTGRFMGINEDANPGTCSFCVKGQVPGLAAAIFAHPVTRVRLTDKRPVPSDQFPGWFRFYIDGDDEAEIVPQEVYQLLEGEHPPTKYGTNAVQPYWRTEAAALDALSAACVKLGRAKYAESRA